MTVSLNELHISQREFVQAREWEKFHTTKNLAMTSSAADRMFSCADELPARFEIMPMTPSWQLAVLGSMCELAGTRGRILETLQWARDDAAVDEELSGTILARLDMFGRDLMTAVCSLT